MWDLKEREGLASDSPPDLKVSDLFGKEGLEGIGKTTIRNGIVAFRKQFGNSPAENEPEEASSEAAIPESAKLLAGKGKRRGLKLKKSAVKKLETHEKGDKKHTVLVVDDEIENLRAVTSTLEAQYQILTAKDGQAGLDLVKSHPAPEQIHVIVSDQRMPRMTGVEFLEETIAITPKTIRILLTGFTDVDAIIDSINKGRVYKFITKPIDPKDLLVTVKRALESFELERALGEMENRLFRCPLTKFFNKTYLLEYLKEELQNCFEYRMDGSLLIMELDGVSEVTLNHGLNTLADITRGMAYVLEQNRDQQHFLYRLDGPAFACYAPFSDMETARELGEKFRNAVEKADVFIKPVTISTGIVNFNEFFDGELQPDVRADVFDLAQKRLNKAQYHGNLVCHESDVFRSIAGKVLIIDNDPFAAAVIQNRLEEEDYEVICCEDGEAGLTAIERERPDVVLAEVMLPKVDGFLIREKTMASSDLKNKVFILMSHLKDENTIQRAVALQIEHYFQKPCMPAEIIGLIRNKLSGRQ